MLHIVGYDCAHVNVHVCLFNHCIIGVLYMCYHHSIVLTGICNAKQKQSGCKKSARPIRSHNGYKRPKSLISSKAKKLNILLRILLLE